MKEILSRLINNETLNRQEAKEILINISSAKYNYSQISSFLTIFMLRKITIDELEGFRQAMLELCVKIDLKAYNLLDMCGTGGDGKDTFNISTLSAFVCAGAGCYVAKHSNYKISSSCGSSDVMEYLKVKFSNEQSHLERTIENSGVAFLHAPLFHPSMKNVAPIRKELGIKTFFNILGPLSNPAQTKNQVTGVFDLEVARIYSYLLERTSKNYNIVYAIDGYDEISLTGKTKIMGNKTSKLIAPKDIGLQVVKPTDIKGGKTVKESAKIFVDILQGKGTLSQRNVVYANAGLGISTVCKCSFVEGIEKAKASLDSGKAYQRFKILVDLSK